MVTYTVGMTTAPWTTAERALDHLGERATYGLSDLVLVSDKLFPEPLTRRYLQDLCRQYDLVLGVQLQRQGRRNFMEIVLSRAQALDILGVVRESRESSRSINDLLRARRDQAMPRLPAPMAPPMDEGSEEEMSFQEQINRLIVETMECKERASGAEDTALQLRKELAQTNAKLDELLSLLRR